MSVATPERTPERPRARVALLTAARRPDPAAQPAAAERPRRPLWPLVLGCLVLAALSLLLPSTPTYDPWAWIGWGREITELDLNTRTGPSWKPLPVLFTTLFAPAGDAAPWLWLVVGRAGALLSLVMAWRLASRLAGPRYALAAGAVAALALVLSEDWLRNSALGNSEPLLVALALLAVERHLDGRSDHALLLGFAAGLLRPEVWPFLGLYGLWAWFAEPARPTTSQSHGAASPAGAKRVVKRTGSGFHDGPVRVFRSSSVISRPQPIQAQGS